MEKTNKDSQPTPPAGAHLVVMIPALNEETTIAGVIRGIPPQIQGIRKIDVVVINDGSTDRTKELAEDAGAIVISHHKNRGVGRSYSTGLHKALSRGADIIVNIDADGQFNPDDIPSLIAPILSGQAEFVTASRFKDPAKTPKMPFGRLYGNRLVARIISGIVGRRFYDVACGFRACTRDAALRLNLTGDYTYTQEMFLDLAFKNVSMLEVPMRVRGTREHGQAKMSANLFTYGNRAIRIILRAYRDYWPWRFFASLAGLCFLISALELGWMMYWRITRGDFTPYKWVGFAAAFIFLVGMMLIVMGIVADMLRMIRLNGEQTLYFNKRRYYDSLLKKEDD
jgi:glycosyltransferase involved in cell wall biosynthesis